MNIIQLPKDLNNICCSYLTNDECIYVNKEWEKFNKNKICIIAAENGWLDLLKWGRQNGCEWNTQICSRAAQNGNLAKMGKTKWL